MTKNKKMMISALPFVALVVLLAVFCGIVSSKGYRLDMYIKIVFNEGIVLSIVATGAIFIYSGVCYNGSNDVRVIRDCIADYYDKRWCGWWNQYSKRGCKTSG